MIEEHEESSQIRSLVEAICRTQGTSRQSLQDMPAQCNFQRGKIVF